MGGSHDREVRPGRRSRRWGTARVSGESMRPTLRPGDLLLIRYGARPRVGRLAVVRLPDRGLAVKRVTRREPEGWWVERDNPAAGVDSWLVGAIPDVDVIAVVAVRLWPAIRRPSGAD
ncbi:S24 family peptidase [Sporichthya sp.]|uniref:S24 family peptidase n=1 Tax=Sporichthya sp. TaxID=65475 RepID=UPI00345C5D8F